RMAGRGTAPGPLERGKAPARAAADATSELTLPVVVATAALIIVLCPVALTPGVGGFLFKPLTMAVAFAMLASFILSWTFVPGLCSKMLTGHGHHGHHDAHGSRPVGFFTHIYSGIDATLRALAWGYSALLAIR